MTFDILTETVRTPAVKEGKRWLVTVAVPGKGSSGDYSADVLREYGPEALPAGTKAFLDHDPRRSIKDMVGVYTEGAFWNEEEQKLQAYLEPFTHYREILNELGPHAEASIHVKGKKDSTGKVIALIPDRANTVDLVGFGGLEGSRLELQVESLFESAYAIDRALGLKTDAEASAQEEEGDTQMKEELDALTAKVEALAETLAAYVEESRAGVKGEADEAAVEAAVSGRLAETHARFLEVKKEIADAGLLKTQAEALEARALTGEDITEALAEAKAVADEIRESATDGTIAVVLGESLSGNRNDDMKIGRWS